MKTNYFDYFILFALPPAIFALVSILPIASARLSLILHGKPFAKIEYKNESSDLPNSRMTGWTSRMATVYSKETPIGYIFRPSDSSFPHFKAFSDNTEEGLHLDIDIWFDFVFPLVWNGRWGIFGAQILVIVIWATWLKRRSR